jgi:UDP-GlcNAc3NAcA epimerase
LIKIVTIIGARPQFVKASMVSKALSKYKKINEIIVHTGQHFDASMSQVFFDEMQIPKPKYNLDIHSLSHGAMTGKMLEKLEAILLIEKPDWVLVYGDTNSTLAGALAAKKLHIKVAHIEAGLRSFNIMMPEEVNRILTDRISDVLFCPTSLAVDNLKKENLTNIIDIGDVMCDTTLFYQDKEKSIDLKYTDNFLLVTLHRAENTDNIEKLKDIIETLNELHQNHPIIMPIHPRTKQKIIENNLDITFNTIDPVSYLEMIYLLKRCVMVLTDSGGLQKEAYFFNKPCITLREETEWMELVNMGVNILVGSSKSEILKAVQQFSSIDIENDLSIYGNGNASKKVAAYFNSIWVMTT